MEAPDIIYDEKTGNRLIGARRDNLIVDARPLINSYAMQVVGKGSENMDHYKSATKMFLSIDNIHVMRSSLNKVIEAVKDADLSSLPPNAELLARSNWIRHIAAILDGSDIIAKQVGVKAAHVLIHCSDGWDRTSPERPGPDNARPLLQDDRRLHSAGGEGLAVVRHMFQQRSGHLNSEKWFVVQNDAMAGNKIEPNDSDSRNEVIDQAISSARRFLTSLSQAHEDSDVENPLCPGRFQQPDRLAPPVPVGDNQATKPKEISPCSTSSSMPHTRCSASIPPASSSTSASYVASSTTSTPASTARSSTTANDSAGTPRPARELRPSGTTSCLADRNS